MRVFNPFGPKIAITKIPKKIINKINKEVDLIVNNKSRSKKEIERIAKNYLKYSSWYK